MNLLKFLFILTLVFSISTQSYSQYITVSENKTITELVEDVLINSPCALISNITVTGNGSSVAESYGYFTSGTSSFPFTDGIILSTGNAISAIGPNGNILSDGNPISQVDLDIQNALGISNFFNATILEFDFQPVSNKISFDYIFSSEQYLSNPSPNQCGFTDGFVFLLKEANTTNPYQNLAVVPGTTTPVTVQTVRGQGTICPAQNELYFDAFNDFQHPTNFNGQTKTLTAQADVTAGTTYHIKMAVADQGNEKYDSAIFLKGGSFNIGVNLGLDKIFATQNPLCDGENLILNATISGAINYKWYKNGALLPFESGSTYQVTSAGVYKVDVIISSSCAATDEITIEYSQPIATTPISLIQCDDNSDGFSIFNITKATDLLPNLEILDYYLNQTDAENEVNKIQNPTNFENITTNQVVIKVKNNFDCVAYILLQLQIANNVNSSVFREYCDTVNEQDGITSFTSQDFDSITTEILTTLPVGYALAYHITSQDAILQINAISFPFTNTTAFEQIIFARVVNGVDCYGIIPVTLQVNTFSPLNFEEETIGICSGKPIVLGVASGFSSYTWDTTTVQTSNQISVSEAGTYSVEVTDAKGCKASKIFLVTASESAINLNIEINDFNGINNAVLINNEGIGDYLYSIDGIIYQESNFFDNLVQGEYTIYIKDKNGCDTVTSDVLVLTYPTFFTPNNDGYNDTWKIKNIDLYPNSTIKIFDRYGKLLKNISANETGWNGKLVGENLPADDYWFILTLTNKKEIKGHFSLKR